MQRLELVDCSDGLHMVDQDNGYWVRYEDAQAEIARLSVALADTQAKLAVAYEAAADACAELNAATQTTREEYALPLVEEAYDVAADKAECCPECADAVRALTPADATTALEARDRRMKAAGMREVAGMNMISWYDGTLIPMNKEWKAAILARADAVERGE